MIKSMTGYGRSAFGVGDDAFSVEVRSLNHRYLDTKIRMPDTLLPIENRVKEEIKKLFSRGSFSLTVYLDTESAPELRVNIPVARAYITAAEELRRETGVSGEVDLALLFRQKDVFTASRKTFDLDSAWEAMKTGLDDAFQQLDEWRVREGAALETDLRERLSIVERFVAQVEELAPEVPAIYRERLMERMKKLIGEGADEQRILQEAAVYAERSDITEEIVRLRSHMEMFRQYLESDEPVGKRLDFLCQEFFREINTIASKGNDARIKHISVELKGELERIREQVQNIE